MLFLGRIIGATSPILLKDKCKRLLLDKAKTYRYDS